MRGHRFGRFLVPALAGALVLVTSAGEHVECAESQSAAQSEVLARSAAWSAAAQGRDVEKVLAFWSDDAVVMPPGSAPIAGKAAIREYVVKSFQTPGFGISWKAEAVTVSRGGDLAWARESNRVTFTGPDGKPVAIDGKAITVWEKGKDGVWRCVADIWNDDAPPPPR
jgi:uncharacterized protein (TIGR02246 family)